MALIAPAPAAASRGGAGTAHVRARTAGRRRRRPRRRRPRSTARGCGSGTSTGPKAADPARIAARAKRARDRHALHQVRRRRQLLEPVQQPRWSNACTPPGSTSAPGQFVYGDAPVAEAKVARGRGQARRRLLRDRRRGPVRRQVRGGGTLHARAARPDRRRLPALARGLPLRRLPPGLPLLGLLRARTAPSTTSRRCTGRRSGPRSAASTSTPTSTTALWGQPLYPLGQTYDGAGAQAKSCASAASPRTTAARRSSWWAWQETNSRGWGALAAELVGPVFGYRPIATNPVLKRGSSGDLVVWAQMHLRAAGRLQLPITGVYGKLTTAPPSATFQAEQALPADGVIGTDDLERTPRARTGPPALGGTPGEARRGGAAASRAIAAAPPALGLAARQGLRDRSRAPLPERAP